MSQDIDALYRDGMAAIRARDQERARGMLEQVVKLDPTHEQGWLWLSAVVDSDAERITCLDNVLTINPHNEEAQRALEKLGGSLEIDTNAAGEPVLAPPKPIHEPEPLPKLEHAAAPAVEQLENAAKGYTPPLSQVIYGLMVLGVLALLVVAIVAILNNS